MSRPIVVTACMFGSSGSWGPYQYPHPWHPRAGWRSRPQHHKRSYPPVAPVHAAGASDLVLRNVNTGQFEVYDIANNQITGAALLGAVGLDWQLGGFALDPPTASTAAMGSSSQVGQLVQAMAGFGGGSGAADGLNAVPLDAETSQQPLLTTPQHA